MNRRLEKPERFGSGWTLVEMILALSLVSMVFVVILPQFRLLQAGWDSKESASEIQQNVRVLQEHLNRHLAAARSISAVSGPAQTLGFVEFQDAAGQTFRYEVRPDGYVYFGPTGDLSLLAGPVTRFQITGFSPSDLVNPAAETSQIRLLRISSDITGTGGRRESFDFSVFLRTEQTAAVLRVLLVVGNPASLSTYERRLTQRLGGWGYQISLLDDNASQSQIDRAAAAADVLVIPSSCGCQNLGAKAAMVPIGVVIEHENCHDDMRISSQEGTGYWAWGVRIVNNSHPITASYGLNNYVVVLNNLLADLVRIRGTTAGGLVPLGMRLLYSDVNLAAIEAGEALWGGQPAPARRVVLPWGYSGFNNSWLTDEGWLILRRSIEWAAGRM
ncbi:MAG: type II secretion system protein [Anaerohalosphaeraceae bacterium]